MTDLVIGRDKHSTVNYSIEASELKFQAILQNTQPVSTLVVPQGVSLMKLNNEIGKDYEISVDEPPLVSQSHIFSTANYDKPLNGDVRKVVPGTTLQFKTFHAECLILVQFYKQ